MYCLPSLSKKLSQQEGQKKKDRAASALEKNDKNNSNPGQMAISNAKTIQPKKTMKPVLCGKILCMRSVLYV